MSRSCKAAHNRVFNAKPPKAARVSRRSRSLMAGAAGRLSASLSMARLPQRYTPRQ